MVVNKANGCSYGQVLNQEVSNIKANMVSGFTSIEKKLDSFEETQTNLFNHMSSRVTRGSVAIWCSLIGVISSLVSILITIALT